MIFGYGEDVGANTPALDLDLAPDPDLDLRRRHKNDQEQDHDQEQEKPTIGLQQLTLPEARAQPIVSNAPLMVAVPCFANLG